MTKNGVFRLFASSSSPKEHKKVKKMLEDRIALVTGGSSGIGRSAALAFAEEGAKVVVADVAAEGGDETVSMIKEAGGEAIFVKTDISKAKEVEALIQKAVNEYGRIDCAFNNAGIDGEMCSLQEHSEGSWDQVISINLKGVWLCMKYEIPQMLKQGRGAIVNTSSIAGLTGIGTIAYCASKHGVVGLTKAAALENATTGIRVNAVCPAAIYTPMVENLISTDPNMKTFVENMQPMGRVGQPEEVSQTVVWLCSDAASFITGHALPIDGGLVAK
jgi:NAD(P)-dependent dehydrogenase (short-subunit alcohol dehydrogenase family)